jgi:hypothetical protein
MQRLVGLALLAVLTIPATASHPPVTRKERPRPTESAEPPLAVPLPAPPSTQEPVFNDRVLETVLCPNQAVARWVVSRMFGDPTDPNVRMNRLLNESEDLRAARQAFQAFWLGNRPSVLSYERLNGADGP